MKPKISLLPPQGILLAAECMTLNEAKYPDPVWETMTVYQHVNASLRHLFEFLKGERDPETGMSHLVHACCRILMAVSREVDAERQLQQDADEHLEVLEPTRIDASLLPQLNEAAPWWVPQDQDEKWIDEFDSKHFGALRNAHPERSEGVDSFSPLEWDAAAKATKPLWAHQTSEGDTTRSSLSGTLRFQGSVVDKLALYDAALRHSTKDSE